MPPALRFGKETEYLTSASLGQIFSHLPKPSKSEKSTHEDTHQGEQIVTTKSQDHVTSLQACQLSILRLSAKFSFAQPYSFSDPEQDPY